jgi:hypothetical protein
MRAEAVQKKLPSEGTVVDDGHQREPTFLQQVTPEVFLYVLKRIIWSGERWGLLINDSLFA